MIIFEIADALGKKIRLTETQWLHILLHHPEMQNYEDKIAETLKFPKIILFDKPKGNYNYYKVFSKTPFGSKFLHVIVKHLNGEGFIITSYITDRIRKIEREIIYENANEL